MNRLASEKSPYLRHAAHQKIDWYPWSEEAFGRAEREDKPVFLATGAIWCHWCHVMARESFEDEEVAEILNQHFISIKLDRDERPDIDRRYQRAVAAMGSGSGWPLSVFLTPEKKPFFGGTYFPPEDSHGRPGFKKVLMTVSDFYKSSRGRVDEYADDLILYLRPGPAGEGEIERSLIEKAGTAVMAEYDPQNGGFGASPKFPMAGAVEFLLNRHFLTRNEATGFAARKTLESMARGGFHDHLGGGFHRYSTDEAWVIPHFEKMADDNSWLLRNYITAYSLFGEGRFRSVAEGIIRFLREVLSDQAGGFYASQDADVTPEDEGGYFTWTEDDFRRVLADEEYRVLSLHLLHERGSMHHDPSKKVLFISMGPENIAEKTGMDLDQVNGLIASGKEKLFREREGRQAPFIDKTLYTSLNGMLITSCLYASRVLGDEGLKDFALKSLDRILEGRIAGNNLLHSEGVKAVLDDYIYITEALTAAYEITGDAPYLCRADDLMKQCIDKFLDRGAGGFFDTDEEVLGIRLRPIEDIPHPSANAVGMILLQKLYNMTGRDDYLSCAEAGLRAFAPDAPVMGLHAAYYFCALDAYFNMIKLTVEALPGSELAATARTSFFPYKSIVYAEDKGCVTPCLANGVCLEPIDGPGKLKDFLKHLS